jgi:hypothetical protein
MYTGFVREPVMTTGANVGTENIQIVVDGWTKGEIALTIGLLILIAIYTVANYTKTQEIHEALFPKTKKSKETKLLHAS